MYLNGIVCRKMSRVLVAFLAGCLAVSPAAGQERDDVRTALFGEADRLIGQCDQAEAAFYAPTFFSQAKKTLERAEQFYSKGERLDKIRSEIEEANSALQKTLEMVEKTMPLLKNVRTEQKTVIRRNLGPADPKLFARAENAVKEAVRKAEANDPGGADKKAYEATGFYRQLALVWLEKNVVKETERQLGNRKAELKKNEYERKSRELKALGDSLKKLKDQARDIESYVLDVIGRAGDIAKLPGMVMVPGAGHPGDGAAVPVGSRPSLDRTETGNVFLWECSEGHMHTGEAGACPECGGTEEGRIIVAEWNCPGCQHIWIARTATCPNCGKVCSMENVVLVRECANGHRWVGTGTCPECGKKGIPQRIPMKCSHCAPAWVGEKFDELQAKRKTGELRTPEQAEAILNGPGSPKWTGANPVCQKCLNNVHYK